MAKFKVGDRVRIRAWDDMANEYGVDRIGDIRTIVNFVRGMEHLCGRIATITEMNDVKCKLNFDDKSGDIGWLYCTQMIENIKPETIVIYRKGDEVIALDKRDGKKAVAKCSPEDTFDFATGAKIAFDRLIGNEQQKQKEPEYWSGKAVFVSDKAQCSGFTMGKVYTFVNGKTVDDNGCERPRGYRIKTLKGYEERYGVLKFIEYKGGDAE